MIATEINLPIVPVYIYGTHRAYPKNVKIIARRGCKFILAKRLTRTVLPRNMARGGRSTAITTEMESRIRKMKELHG